MCPFPTCPSHARSADIPASLAHPLYLANLCLPHLAHYAYTHPQIIGIGSGSTVPYVVERIVAQGAEANRDRIFVPTGFQSKALILNSKLNLGDVEQFGDIDVTIDGADEVSRG